MGFIRPSGGSSSGNSGSSGSRGGASKDEARLLLNPRDAETVPAGSELVFVASKQSVHAAGRVIEVGGSRE